MYSIKNPRNLHNYRDLIFGHVVPTENELNRYSKISSYFQNLVMDNIAFRKYFGYEYSGDLERRITEDLPDIKCIIVARPGKVSYPEHIVELPPLPKQRQEEYNQTVFADDTEGKHSVTINVCGEWTAEPFDSWLWTVPEGGIGPGEVSFKIGLEQNNTGVDRKALIKVTNCDGLFFTVHISQLGAKSK